MVIRVTVSLFCSLLNPFGNRSAFHIKLNLNLEIQFQNGYGIVVLFLYTWTREERIPKDVHTPKMLNLYCIQYIKRRFLGTI